MYKTIQFFQIFHNPTRTLSFDIQVTSGPVHRLLQERLAN